LDGALFADFRRSNSLQTLGRGCRRWMEYPMRIESRIAWTLALCLLGGVAVAGYISYALEARQSREEVSQSATLLLEAALAVRGYTTDEIEPLLQPGMAGTSFHPQTIPAYAAQATVGRVHDKIPQFSYREAALNPTNVADRASDWEVGLLRQFREHPERKEIFGEHNSGADASFYLARLIRVDNGACLSCHSDPAVAPKEMLAKYGGANGFGWKLGDLIGLQIVEVPFAPAHQRAIHSVLVTVGSLACVLVLSATVFLILLRKHVLRPLGIVTRRAEAASLAMPEATDASELKEVGAPFGDLLTAIHRLQKSIDDAAGHLGPAGKRDDRS